jgi:hypothetical protein
MIYQNSAPDSRAGVASSNLVIPTSIYKDRPSRGRSCFLCSGPIPVQITSLSDNLRSQECSVGVFQGGVSTPGCIWREIKPEPLQITQSRFSLFFRSVGGEFQYAFFALLAMNRLITGFFPAFKSFLLPVNHPLQMNLIA